MTNFKMLNCNYEAVGLFDDTALKAVVGGAMEYCFRRRAPLRRIQLAGAVLGH